MTPLRTTRAREIRATLIRAAEIALDFRKFALPFGDAWDLIWYAALRSNAPYLELCAHYDDVMHGQSHADRQRNCWALLLAAAAVED